MKYYKITKYFVVFLLKNEKIWYTKCKYFLIKNMLSTKQKGDIWEIIAIKYLQRNDYKILETNYKFGRFWEIDVIANKNNIYYFIEVKYRSSEKYGTAEESITKSKLYKLEKSIYSYCMKKRIDLENISFEVITIIKGQKSNKLTHYKNISLS